MRLSEYMILGDTIKTCDSGTWISTDGSCGCALGGALLAAGVTPAEFDKQYHDHPNFGMGYEWMTELECIKSRWPWLTGDHVREISQLYCRVERGEKNIEDVAAYVRTIEPNDESMRREHVRHALEFKEELEGDEGDEQPEDLKGYPDPQFEANGRY